MTIAPSGWRGAAPACTASVEIPLAGIALLSRSLIAPHRHQTGIPIEQRLRALGVRPFHAHHEVRLVRARNVQRPIALALPDLDTVDELPLFLLGFLHEPSHDGAAPAPGACDTLLAQVHWLMLVRACTQRCASLCQSMQQPGRSV